LLKKTSVTLVNFLEEMDHVKSSITTAYKLVNKVKGS